VVATEISQARRPLGLIARTGATISGTMGINTVECRTAQSGAVTSKVSRIMPWPL